MALVSSKMIERPKISYDQMKAKLLELADSNCDEDDFINAIGFVLQQRSFNPKSYQGLGNTCLDELASALLARENEKSVLTSS